MPTSIEEGKDFLDRLFEHHRPNTVLDVGPGEGTYAKRWRKVHQGVWWTAVEIFEPYIKRFNLLRKGKTTKSKYDEIHVMDIREAPDHLFHRDLVIFGDVLEHMPKEDAEAVLARAVKVGAYNIVVSVPTVEAPQGEVDGNPHEAHVHHYTFEEMTDMLIRVTGGNGIMFSREGETVSVWWWYR